MVLAFQMWHMVVRNGADPWTIRVEYEQCCTDADVIFSGHRKEA